MRSTARLLILLTLPLLFPAPGVAAAPARLEPWLPGGAARSELGRVPRRWEPAMKNAGAISSGLAEAAAAEVGLGVTTANESFNELRQSVALLKDGGYASVWVEGPFLHRDVRMQWVRPDGSPVFASGGLTVANAPEDEYLAVVAANPLGGAFVAFTRDIPNGREVRVQSYDAGGAPRWPADGVLLAVPDLYAYHAEMQLAATADGGLFGCAGVFHPTATSNLGDVVCQRLGSDGQRLWTDAGVQAGDRPGWKVLPKIVGDRHGGLLVFWRNQRLALTDPRPLPMLMEGQHLTAGGARLWGPHGLVLRTTNLVESNGYSYSFYGAVPDGSGGAILTFNDWNGRGRPSLDVLAQRVTGDGRLPWGKGVAVASGAEQQQHDAAIPAPGGGAFVTVWSPARGGLALYRLRPNGRTAWHQPVASTDSGSSPNDYQAFGAVDGGRLRLAWTHQRQDGTFDIDVYLALFDLAGRRLNGAAATPVTTAADAQFLRGLVFDPARGQGFAVWEDRRKGTWDDLDTMGGLYTEAP